MVRCVGRRNQGAAAHWPGNAGEGLVDMANTMVSEADCPEGRLHRIAQSLTNEWPSLRLIGLGVWWGWIWICYSSSTLMQSYPAHEQTTYVMGMYIFSTFSIGLMVLLSSAFWKKWQTWVENSVVVVSFGLLASVATLAVAVSARFDARLAMMLFAVATGVGTSFICLRVGHVYGRTGLRDGFVNGAVSVVLAMFLYFVGVGLPNPYGIGFASLLPVAAAIILCLPSKQFEIQVEEKPAHLRISHNAPMRNLYCRLVVACGLTALASGFGKGLACTLNHGEAFFASGPLVSFAVGVCMLVIVVVACSSRGPRTIARIYSIFMVLFIAIFLMSGFGLSLAFAVMAKEVLFLIFTCLLAYVVMRFGISPCRYFGLGQAVYFLCSGVGWLLGGMMPPLFLEGELALPIALVLAAALLVVVVFVFTEDHIKQIGDSALLDEAPMALSFDEKSADDEATSASDGGTGSSSAPFVDPSYGLSQRETEVLLLFAQGRSANWIADELYISNSTVRTHLRNAYTKLGVHSRQELLNVVNVPRS